MDGELVHEILLKTFQVMVVVGNTDLAGEGSFHASPVELTSVSSIEVIVTLAEVFVEHLIINIMSIGDQFFSFGRDFLTNFLGLSFCQDLGFPICRMNLSPKDPRAPR